MVTADDMALCPEMYAGSVAVFAVIGYIYRRVFPFGRYVPQDFVRPDRYIGSFSRGQLASFVISALACPLSVAAMVLLT